MQAAAQLPSAPPSQAAQQPLNQLKNRRKVRQLQKTDTSTYAPALNLTGWGGCCASTVCCGRDRRCPASACRVEIAGRQFSLGMLSALVLGTMILGVLAYIVVVRPAHDGATAANYICCQPVLLYCDLT